MPTLACKQQQQQQPLLQQAHGRRTQRVRMLQLMRLSSSATRPS
jgi:hypothetical protein